MLDLSTFGKKIKLLGFDFFAGVPCSFLNPLINYALNECEFIMSPTEADAVATASGAYIGGRKAVVLMQNSGLANAVSALTSLTFCFRIPLLGFVSLRGEVGLSDEPQHELMGQITTELLDCMRIPWAFLSPDEVEAQKQLENANKIIDKGSAFFLRKILYVRPQKGRTYAGKYVHPPDCAPACAERGHAAAAEFYLQFLRGRTGLAVGRTADKPRPRFSRVHRGIPYRAGDGGSYHPRRHA